MSLGVPPPTVIDEPMLIDGAKAQREQDLQKAATDSGFEAETVQKAIAFEEPVLSEVKAIALSFKNIKRIDNLQQLSSLQNLRLDNNTITKIEHLDMLVHLRWLDLSFNNITEITGLDALGKLEDLSLFNNRISVIQNLDNNTNLQCLSIGNNQITGGNNWSSVMYLRQFSKLHLVNLEGNPLCKDPEYKHFLLAHLKYLKYLDYSSVNEDQLIVAREQYQDELLEVEEKEGIEESARKTEEIRAKRTAVLAEANCAVAEILFDEMISEDQDHAKLKLLPGLTDLFDDFHEKYNASADEFIAAGELKQKERVEEVRAFDYELRNLQRTAAESSTDLLRKYTKHKKKVMNDRDRDPSTLSAGVSELRASNDQMMESLKDIEMNLLEQCLNLINSFDRAYEDIKNKMSDLQQKFFREVEDQENNYSEAVTELATELLDKMANGGFQEGDLSEESAALLQDKETVNQSISGSHDAHLGKLLAHEDEVRETENSRCASTISKYADSERNRNRSRINEIVHTHRLNEEELQDILDEAADYNDD